MLISHCKAKLQNYTAWEKKTFPGLLSFRVTIIQLTLLHNSSDFYFNHIWIQFRLGKIAFFLTKVVVNIKLFSSVFIFADRAEYFNLIDHFWTFYLYIHSKDMLLQNMTQIKYEILLLPVGDVAGETTHTWIKEVSQYSNHHRSKYQNMKYTCNIM